jgi:pyruvate formate lyase activating enzyme
MKSANISRNGARSSPQREVRASSLRIGGFEPFSTVDYPGRLAAVIFCQGCPLRCGYCHNPDLIPVRTKGLLSFEAVYSAIEMREDFLDAVVFSGGEPLAQAAVIPAMAAIRRRGLEIGLHTAGTSPALFEAALPFVNWVGFDVKAPFDGYRGVAGVDAGAKARRSLEMLALSGVPYEVRTTVWPERIGKAEIWKIASALRDIGVRQYALQEARTPDRNPWPGGDALNNPAFISKTAAMFEEFEVRRAS